MPAFILDAWWAYFAALAAMLALVVAYRARRLRRLVDAETKRRHAAEAAVNTADQRIELITDATRDAIYDWNFQTGQVWRSTSRYAPFERREGEGDAEWWVSQVHPEDQRWIWEDIQKVFASDASHWTGRYRRLCSDGRYVEVEDHALLVRNDAGQVVRVIGAIADVSSARQAEHALRESEERFRLIIQNTTDIIAILSPDGAFTFISPASEPLTGFAPSELVGTSAFSLIHPDDLERVQSVFMALVAAPGANDSVTFRLLRKQGGYTDVESAGVNLIDNPTINGILISSRDITERKEAEYALRESETRYRDLFENANDAVYTHDLEGRFLSLNGVGEQLTGYTREEALQMRISHIVAPEYLALAQEMIARKMSESASTMYEIEIVRKDGQRVPVEVSTRIVYRDGRPALIQGIARDISIRRRAEAERKLLEAQVQHAQKLESLGVLAGGIAHDFNNTLMGVLGNASLALMDLPDDSPMRETIEQIETAAQRAAALCRQLLAYSGKGKFIVTPIDLSALIREMHEFTQAAIAKQIEVIYDLDPAMKPVEGDAGQLRQILVNLVSNASDAIGESRGLIRIRTGIRSCGRNELAELVIADELEEGEYAFLEVEDNGPGMDDATRQRVFEPFFTTKFMGRGLGMPAVLGIVRGHHGGIRVKSKPGAGAIFTVYFPIAMSETETAPKPEPAEQTPAGDGHGAILVVDDERVVRDLAANMLRRAGYTVMTAVDGQDAVEKFQQHAAEIELVLLDVTMPRLNGVEAFKQIRHIRDDARVILSSAYGEPEVTDGLESGDLAGFIQKPYRTEDLLDTIGRVLRVAH